MTTSLIFTIIQGVFILLLAPLSMGLVRKFKAFLQGRCGAPIWLPYISYLTMLKKEMAISPITSFVFRLTPYMVLGTTIVLALILPLITNSGAFASLSNFMIVAGVLAFGSAFLCLGALDAGGAFGGIGATREMTVVALGEAVIIVVFATFALVSGNAQIAHMMNVGGSALLAHPFLILSVIALAFIALAENARYPVDNPATHLELTMIHEATVLEYSGAYLAMLEYAASLKLTIFAVLLANFLYPLALTQLSITNIAIVLGLAAVKLIVVMFALAVLESIMAKMRFYRLQEYFSTAFFIAMLGFVLTLIFKA